MREQPEALLKHLEQSVLRGHRIVVSAITYDRNAGSTLAPAVWFAYSPDRKGIHPQTHLAGFSGVLQADALKNSRETLSLQHRRLYDARRAGHGLLA